MMNGIYALDRAIFDQIEALQRLDASAVERLTAMAAKMEVSAGPAARSEAGGTIGIIPIYGVIEQRRSLYGMLFGGTSLAAVSAALRQAEDESVKAIVLDFATPGGEVFAVSETAEQIRSLRLKKPVVAVHNRFAASAGYWLSSAASEIVAPNDAMQGSIGVYKTYVDTSEADAKAGIKRKTIAAGEFKADAVGGGPMSDEGEKSVYEMVNHIYSIMKGDIAEGRGVAKSKVEADFGKGLLLTAPAALAAGMVDRIGTMDETLKRLSTPQGRAAVMRADSFAFASYKQGDRVRVKPGKHHDEMTKGKAGSVEEVSSAALGIKFDGMDKVHKWYTAEELDAESVNAYDGEAERRILVARATV